ncbi:hypothetical protein [Roseovarius sp. D22-M7]|uniref:hypothetical protein n=1 Tax=Roseovarius sp. D22-M7 TaxID=3127116 RepID=UPI00300FD028
MRRLDGACIVAVAHHPRQRPATGDDQQAAYQRDQRGHRHQRPDLVGRSGQAQYQRRLGNHVVRLLDMISEKSIPQAQQVSYNLYVSRIGLVKRFLQQVPTCGGTATLSRPA